VRAKITKAEQYMKESSKRTLAAQEQYAPPHGAYMLRTETVILPNLGVTAETADMMNRALMEINNCLRPK
jgi:hypothetical protein